MGDATDERRFDEVSHDSVNAALAGAHKIAPAMAALRRLVGGGTDGNEQLTTVTGALLIPLLAVIGVTLLRMRQLLSVHLFVGMLLIGPVALKLGSTGYRFARYYSGSSRYRLKGPPPTALRAIAPAVVVSTVAVIATGVALLAVGPHSRGLLLALHKASFIVWLAFTAVHVLAHLPETLAAVQRMLARSPERAAAGAGQARPPAALEHSGLDGYGSGRLGRALAISAAVVGGVVLAILLIPHYDAWLHWNALGIDR